MQAQLLLKLSNRNLLLHIILTVFISELLLDEDFEFPFRITFFQVQKENLASFQKVFQKFQIFILPLFAKLQKVLVDQLESLEKLQCGFLQL